MGDPPTAHTGHCALVSKTNRKSFECERLSATRLLFYPYSLKDLSCLPKGICRFGCDDNQSEFGNMTIHALSTTSNQQPELADVQTRFSSAQNR